MKVIYDPEVDVLRILFQDITIAESDEDENGIIFDYDRNGAVVAIEILNTSERVDDPRSISYVLKHSSETDDYYKKGEEQ